MPSGFGDIGAMAAAGLLGALGGTGLYSAIRREDKSSPARDDWIADTIAGTGLDVGYSHEPGFIDFGEYVTDRDQFTRARKDFSEVEPELMDMHPATHAAILRRMERLSDSVGDHGLVLTGAGNKRKDTIAHELGHATAAHSGSTLDKLLHKMNYGPLLSALAGVGGGIGGALMSSNPLKGGLAGGLGAGLISSIPVAADEYNASRLGKKLLGDEGDEVSYNPPINYLMAPALIGGGAGLGAGSSGKLLDILKRSYL